MSDGSWPLIGWWWWEVIGRPWFCPPWRRGGGRFIGGDGKDSITGMGGFRTAPGLMW